MNLYLNCHDSNSSNSKIDPLLVNRLKIMLDEVNRLIQYMKLKLISSKTKYDCNYNIQICSKVVTLIIGDIDSSN